MKFLNHARSLGVAATLCALGYAFPATLLAQPAASTEFKPSVGQAGKDVIWVPTPDRVVDRMLRIAEVTANDFVIDLGSGDGKIAIAAARTFGARAMGLEYNPDMVTLSQRHARAAGVADKVEFRQADIFASDFSRATVVTMYLLPGLNLKLRPIIMRMKPGTRVASHSFDMGAWQPDETTVVGAARAYLWIVPANAQGQWKVSLANNSALQTFNIKQRYQKVEGDASFGETDSSLRDALLDGDKLTFSVHDQQGRRLYFTGRISGNQMSGTVTSPGQPQASFTAQRTSQVQPIDEVAGDFERADRTVSVIGRVPPG